ncbi:MAG: DUF4340 domain-containing protein [Bacillota bacterium]|nr:DUF4340 domain-containing protein [Bacillota bacterium]
MRTFRNVIILAVVMVALVGAFIGVSMKKGKDTSNNESQPTTKLTPLMEAKKDDIVEYTIENQGDKFTVAHKGTDWTLVYPAGVNFSKVETENMANNAASISSSKLVEENATDLSKYGLNHPAVFTVKTKDGKVQVLEIGNNTPTGDGAYVKLKDSNKVYVVDINMVSPMKVSKYFFWEKTLFNMKTEDIKTLSLERGGKIAFKVNLHDDKKWYLTEPMEGAANSSKLEPYLNELPSLTADSIEEDKPKDLAEFGLDKPTYIMTIETKTGTKKLYLGTEVIKGQQIYGKLAGSDTIYVLPVSKLNYLDLPLKELVEGLVYTPDITDVSEFTVDMDGKSTNIKLQLDPNKNIDKDIYTVDGKEAVKKNEDGEMFVRVFYRAIIGVGFSDLDAAAVPSGKPEITFTYTLKKAPGTVKVEYIPKDATTYYAVINGKYTGKIISKVDFDMPDGPRDDLRKLKESIGSK